MWFRKRDRVRETAEAIVAGLADGTLAPDPLLGRDPGVALPSAEPGAGGRTGDWLHLDLTTVPESLRPAVKAEIFALIRKATPTAPQPQSS
jgi:hypothetical protein